MRLIYFLRLGRPLFLVGGILLHTLGVLVALYDGAELNLPALLWGQLAVTNVQLMTHYGNDYFDLAADRANPTPTRWSGGSRILAEGYIAPRLALITALFAGFLALVAAFVLFFSVQTGPLTLPLLILALIWGWSYSAPPLQLHSTGIGELAGAALITGLTPLVGYYLQAARLALLPLLAVAPLVGLQFVMLILIEFPDAQGDAAAGKDTLVVRLGAARAARIVLLALAAVYAALPALELVGLPWRAAAALVIFGAPAALWLAWRLVQGAWEQPAWWNWLGFVGVALVVGSATVELAAFASLVF